MKKRYFKVLGLTLAVLLAMTAVLAGCGNVDQPVSDGGGTSDAATGRQPYLRQREHGSGATRHGRRQCVSR